MTFIRKLEFFADHSKMLADLETILKMFPWPADDLVKQSAGNQISITHRPGAVNQWLDGSGSLVNRSTGEILGYESDFSNFNDFLPEYTRQILESLKITQNSNFGRIRYMRLMPKTGLSIHTDVEQRFHYVLKTSPGALFGEYLGGEETAATCHHIPADGHFYHVDTTRPHFVYNGSWEPRIHLVICKTSQAPNDINTL
jgi:hypothetical protein